MYPLLYKSLFSYTLLLCIFLTVMLFPKNKKPASFIKLKETSLLYARGTTLIAFTRKAACHPYGGCAHSPQKCASFHRLPAGFHHPCFASLLPSKDYFLYHWENICNFTLLYTISLEKQLLFLHRFKNGCLIFWRWRNKDI